MSEKTKTSQASNQSRTSVEKGTKSTKRVVVEKGTRPKTTGN